MTEFVPLKIAVLTVSDSRTATNDKSGAVLESRLIEAGHELAERTQVPDDRYAIRAIVSRWIAADEVDTVIMTGGTGLTGRDGTPEAVTPLLDRVIDGFGEAFRMLSWEEIGTSTLQSRALAGVANATILFVLPGSPGACRTAWDRIIVQQLDARTKPCNLVELRPRMNER